MDCVEDIVAQDYDLRQEIRYWQSEAGLSEASLRRYPDTKYWRDRLSTSVKNIEMLTAASMLVLHDENEAIA